jgi:hypothetical protein
MHAPLRTLAGENTCGLSAFRATNGPDAEPFVPLRASGDPENWATFEAVSRQFGGRVYEPLGVPVASAPDAMRFWPPCPEEHERRGNDECDD